MIHAAAFLLSLGGFAMLLLARPRQHQDWLGRELPPMRTRVLGWSGFAVLALAFLVTAAGFGWGYGTVAWSGWLSVGAALTVIAHANRERIVRRFRRTKQ